MNKIADITIKCLLSSGFALGLAVMSLYSASANASDWGYRAQSPGIDGLDRQGVTTLMTFEVSAATGTVNNDSLDISASFKGIALDSDNNLGYSEYTHDFQLSAPVRAMDFSDEIRERTQLSPQKMLDNMIIDGGLGFNLNW
ncbi:MAG: hypothetical protein R3208_04620 [Ketobacteraceae bacterium]|nr:hypothetical protein [Ketobacteraceae bacterium]